MSENFEVDLDQEGGHFLVYNQRAAEVYLVEQGR